jgi:hypothetical protein
LPGKQTSGSSASLFSGTSEDFAQSGTPTAIAALERKMLRISIAGLIAQLFADQRIRRTARS